MAKKTTKPEPAADGGENQDDQVQPQAGGPGPDATPNPSAEGASIINSTAGAKAAGEEPNLFNSNLDADKPAETKDEQVPVEQTDATEEEDTSEPEPKPTPVDQEPQPSEPEPTEPVQSETPPELPDQGPVKTDVPAQKPTVNRIVNFVPEPGSPEAHNGAEVVPAIIVRVWGESLVNLKVFSDGPDTTWLGSVSFSETGEPRTWHWPPRV